MQDLEKVERDLAAIKQFRANFEASRRHRELLHDLRDCQESWREEVLRNRHSYIQAVKARPRRGFRGHRSWGRDSQHDLDLLERVASWESQRDTSNGAENQDPRVVLTPEHNINASVMYFKKPASGEGWQGSSSDLISGSFPDQEVSIHDLLEPGLNSPLSEPCPVDTLRYFHLPANNMSWIEVRNIHLWGSFKTENCRRKLWPDITTKSTAFIVTLKMFITSPE